VSQNKREVVKGFKTNTVGKNIKQLIIFLKNRKQKKIVPDLDTAGFKIPEEEADAIYLTPEEINQVLLVDLSDLPHLNKYRDLLVFGCLTGLRFSDFTITRSDDVRDGMLYKKQCKTKHWVVVPLRDEAYNIFMNNFNRNIPATSNPDSNFYIKKSVGLPGFFNLLSTLMRKAAKIMLRLNQNSNGSHRIHAEGLFAQMNF
jgi:hypothetical protein